MNKITKRIALYFILAINIFPIAITLMDDNHMKAIQLSTPKITYLKAIEGTEQEQTQVKDILEEFNSLSSVNLVPTTGLRPITITFVDDILSNVYTFDTVLGQAFVYWSHCPIQLARAHIKDDNQTKNLVIHEYLHCFGYDHLDKPTDLMYYYIDFVDSQSINNYAEDLSKRLK